MQIIDAPLFVDCMVAAMATSPTGEVGAVICARDVECQYMLICDAVVGTFSAFDEYCEALFDRLDEMAGTMRSRLAPCVYVDPDLFARVGGHTRMSADGFKPPVNATVDTRFYPPQAEQDPARRATQLAAAGDTVRLSAAMTKKILTHPYDQLASARYDPGAPNVLADALGRAFDITMVTNTERRKAQHRRGEL